MSLRFENQEGDGSPIAAINVTPFVDVVLVLLVIFMVTAPLLLRDVLGIQLPRASSSDAKMPVTIGLAVTRQGQYLLNGQMVGTQGLSSEVRRVLRSNPEAQAIIGADTEARHGDVVRAIDLLKQAGLHRFAIQIERESER